MTNLTRVLLTLLAILQLSLVAGRVATRHQELEAELEELGRLANERKDFETHDQPVRKSKQRRTSRGGRTRDFVAKTASSYDIPQKRGERLNDIGDQKSPVHKVAKESRQAERTPKEFVETSEESLGEEKRGDSETSKESLSEEKRSDLEIRENKREYGFGEDGVPVLDPMTGFGSGASGQGSGDDSGQLDSDFGNQLLGQLTRKHKPKHDSHNEGIGEKRGEEFELVEEFFSQSMFQLDRSSQERLQQRREQEPSEDEQMAHDAQSNLPYPEQVDDVLTLSPLHKRNAHGITGDKPVDVNEGCNILVIANTTLQILYSHEEYKDELPYGNGLDCVFQIHTPDNYYLWINFIHFDMEEDAKCTFDYVQIFRDELATDNNITEKLCGQRSPPAVIVPSDQAFVHFHTDSSEARRGFKLEFKAFHPSTIPQRICIYGDDPTCAFPCHCASDCNPVTGGCLLGGCLYEEAKGNKLEESWTGEACRQGNVALDKHAYTLTGDADAVTDGYIGHLDHCVTVKAETSAESIVTVDLGGLYQVDYVQVYGAPKDTPEAETLRDFYVKQSSSRDNSPAGCGSYLGQVDGSAAVSCPVNTRFLSITRRQDAIYTKYDMVICEIQVFGHKVYSVDCDRCAADNCDDDKLCTQCQVTFTAPTCGSIVDCGDPPEPEHGGVEYISTHRPSVAVFYCDEGYTLKGYKTAACGYESDEWDGSASCVRQCGAVPAIANALYPGVNGGVEGEYVEYECRENYVMTGGRYLVCSDGAWVNPLQLPKCEEMLCKAFEVNDAHIRLIYSNGTDPGSVAIYSCDEGYFIRGQVDNYYTMRCQVNGGWDKPIPACEAFCGDFYASTQGTLVSQNYPSKYPAKINCTWVVQAPLPGDRFNVIITDMEIEFASECMYDNLNLYESNGHRVIPIGQYCGSNLPGSILTKGNYLIVNFYSDEAFQGRGFRIEYNTIRSDDMMDATNAMLSFYPMLMGEHILHVDSEVFAEAITYMRSYMLTVTNLLNHGDCLFLLEAIDAAYNILAHHTLPEVQKYVIQSFARLEMHAPEDYHTMKFLQQVQQEKTIAYIIEKLYEPYVDLGHQSLALSGLEITDANTYDAMNGLVYHWLEELLFEKTYIVPTTPAEELANNIAIESHRKVTAVLGTSPSSEVICRPLFETLNQFMTAVDATISRVERLLAGLPMIIRDAFGPEAEDFAALFIAELGEDYERLSLPLDVIVALRDQIFNVELSDLPNIGSGTTPIPGVITPQELKIKFTGPATHVLLQHGLEQTILITKEDHIKADIMKQMLLLVPDAKMVLSKDLDKATIEALVRAFVDRITEMTYATCLNPKLASMLIGFAEVQLFDIALADHNITALSMELTDIIASEVPGVDWKAVMVNLMNNFRGALFDNYRQHFLEFEEDIMQAFNGNIKATKTAPLDLLLILSANSPHSAYELIDEFVETLAPSLRHHITCPSSAVYTDIRYAVESFLTRFSVDTILKDIFSNLMFIEEIPQDITEVVFEKMEAHMTKLLQVKLTPYVYLRMNNNQFQYSTTLREHVIEELAVLVHNAIHFSPMNNDAQINVEDLVKVIHRQHEGMQAVLQQYILGLRQILEAVGGARMDICEVYPDACDFCLNLSLTRR